MNIRVKLSSHGQPEIWADEHIIISRLDLEIPRTQIEGQQETVLTTAPWEWLEESDQAHPVLRRVVLREGEPLLTAEIRSDQGVITFAVTVEQTLSNLSVGDTFDAFSIAFPRISVPDSYRCFLTTYGLGPSGNGGVGGYWPEAIVANSTNQLPASSFSPIVLFDDSNALAIAPTSQFLTSTLIGDRGDIIRTLHGSIDTIAAGTCIETLFAGGKDVTAALIHAGDMLLARGGKVRPDPNECVMTSKLGWWNAYGGYYTEPIHPLNGDSLIALIESLRHQGVPIEYLGLDLWYPYSDIGHAIRFSPDLGKYPDGVGSIAEKFHLPTVLHLSALSDENEYRANGSDPVFYRQVAAELRSQGAQVAWHDWLRTQQHITPTLRQDAAAADAWFNGMAQAMADEGISVLTCMHTMGMVLGSTALPNVIAARSSIDYLFAQPEALDTLERLGLGSFRDEQTPLSVIRRQNLLVGFTYYALGLLPFYDLFLTCWHDDIGGTSPQAEAILRALSCGPIGIGDGPGMTDIDLVTMLVSASGNLLQPDHPPYPDASTLGCTIEVYRTERKTSSANWEYIVALNTTTEDQSFDLSAPTTEVIILDGMNHQVVERMQGSLSAGELAYYVLIPLVEDIAPLGLWNKAVPAPSHVILDAEWKDGWHIRLDAPGETFAIWTSVPITVADQEGRQLQTRQQGSFALCPLGEGVSSLHITRRLPA